VFFFWFSLVHVFRIEVSHLLFCKMCFNVLFSFSLLVAFKLYVFILLTKYLIAACLCSCG